MEYSPVVSRVTVRPAHSQPLIDWQEVSSLCRFICVLITFVSHHRLLTRGHDLAVLSIMPFSILETCHLIVKPCTRSPSYCAVIVTSTLSSSHADSYRLDPINRLPCCILCMHRFLVGRCEAHLYTIHQVSVCQALPSNRLMNTHIVYYGEECRDYYCLV